MKFIQPYEHILAFDNPKLILSVEDMQRLVDCGVETTFATLDWSAVEPKRGVYDFSVPDAFYERCRKSGMKGLLLVADSVCPDLPNEWYAKSWAGQYAKGTYSWNALSLWNSEAQEYQLEFYRLVKSGYGGLDRFSCVRGGPHAGEGLMPCEPFYYDDCALASYRAFMESYFGGDLTRYCADNHVHCHSWQSVTPPQLGFVTPDSWNTIQPVLAWLREAVVSNVVKQQEVFAQTAHKEVWFCLTYTWYDLIPSGNEFAGDVYRAVLEQVKTSKIYTILFEIYTHREWQAEYWANLAKSFRDDLGVECFVGSQYLHGLSANLERAISQGFYGFITNPLCGIDGQMYQSIEPWMQAAIRNSLERWREVR